MAINYALALHIIYHHISPEFHPTLIWAGGYRGGIVRYAERSLYDNESVLIPRKGTLNNVD
jgi:hypothetical protein